MATTINLRIDKAKTPSARITVEGSGRTPHAFRGNATSFRVAVFDAGGAVADLSDHASLNLAYMPDSRAEDAVAAETSPIVDASFTEEEWIAGGKWHAQFDFSEGDMNPDLGTGLMKAFWFVCYGILSGSGHEVTHGGASLTVEEDGTQNTVAAPDPPETAATPAQVAAAIETAVSGLMPNPMEAAGDIIIGGEEGAPERLAAGEDGDVLSMVDGAPVWTPPAPAPGGGMPYEREIAPPETPVISGNTHFFLATVAGTITWAEVETTTDSVNGGHDPVVYVSKNAGATGAPVALTAAYGERKAGRTVQGVAVSPNDRVGLIVTDDGSYYGNGAAKGMRGVVNFVPS